MSSIAVGRAYAAAEITQPAEMPAHVSHRSLDSAGGGGGVLSATSERGSVWLTHGSIFPNRKGCTNHSYKSGLLSFIACAMSIKNGFQFSPLNAALRFNAGANPLYVLLYTLCIVTLVVRYPAA